MTKAPLHPDPRRFYDTDGGEVTLGGYDVKKLTLASLRGALGKVRVDGLLCSHCCCGVLGACWGVLGV